MGHIQHTFDLHHFKPRGEMDQHPQDASGFGETKGPVTGKAPSPIMSELQPVESETKSAGEGNVNDALVDKWVKQAPQYQKMDQAEQRLRNTPMPQVPRIKPEGEQPENYPDSSSDLWDSPTTLRQI